MEPIVKNTNQDIVLLGGCIHMGTDLLLLEIMDDKNYVICLECGEKMKRLVNTHLKKHGLTVTSYKEKYFDQ